MTCKVILETRAIRDIDEATGWIAAQSTEAADRWFNQIESAVLSLARFPHRCPLARENGRFPHELRQLVYGRRRGRYRIIFTIQSDTVHVLHVRHGARPSMSRDEIEKLFPPGQ